MKFSNLRHTMKTFVRSKLVWGLCAALTIVALWPGKAVGQLGLDPCCAIISVGLSTISNLLKGVVAQPLGQIQQLRQQALSFEQQVVYPVNAINQAQAMATQFQGQFAQMRQLTQTSVMSATLPSPQQLQQQLLSANTGSISNVGSSYSAVYGPVMGPSDASPQLRDAVDMTDAESQAAMKKAIEIDALANLELQAAESMNQQLQNAAPGTAPMIEAQASAWVVRANAYTQSAMAELVRVRSVELANSGDRVKFSTAHSVTLRNHVNQILGTPQQ